MPARSNMQIRAGAASVWAARKSTYGVMARRRLEKVEEAGAEVVLTECNSCVHNLNNAKLKAQKFEIFTTAQFLNQLLEEKG